MINQDFINFIFETFGFIFIILSINKLLRNKDSSGVSSSTILFFISWGIWNIYYYPYLSQHWSALGAVLTLIANIIWFILILYYDKNIKNKN